LLSGFKNINSFLGASLGSCAWVHARQKEPFLEKDEVPKEKAPADIRSSSISVRTRRKLSQITVTTLEMANYNFNCLSTFLVVQSSSRLAVCACYLLYFGQQKR